jgi:hypothetical protein
MSPSNPDASKQAEQERLPERAQNLIRKYSGEWVISRYVEVSDAIGRDVIATLRSDPRRKVNIPTAADRVAAREVFDGVAENWAALSPRNRELLNLVRIEIAKLRSSK